MNAFVVEIKTFHVKSKALLAVNGAFQNAVLREIETCYTQNTCLYACMHAYVRIIGRHDAHHHTRRREIKACPDESIEMLRCTSLSSLQSLLFSCTNPCRTFRFCQSRSNAIITTPLLQVSNYYVVKPPPPETPLPPPPR